MLSQYTFINAVRYLISGAGRLPFYFLASLLIIPFNLSHASSLEKILMPGELVQSHAEFEDDCSKCHDNFKKISQEKLCLDCHAEINDDINTGRGYHGLNKKIKTSTCKSCHTDHTGRKADIVLLNKDTFTHKLTDFPLKGGHIGVQCASCHKPGETYYEAPMTCIDCHKKDDRHKGKLGEKCADCHNEKAWSKPDFDHDKTSFVLLGKHKKVACDSCHAGQRYKNTPDKCYDCHALNDAHAGTYGKKCNSCHTPEKWKQVKFNHDKETHFPLRGKHKKATCASCHKDNIYKELASECSSCHLNDDVHKGRNGKKCNNCHTPDKWKTTTFNHDKDTKFRLNGRHSKLDCIACHRDNAYKDKLESKCISCHQADDVHKGKQGESCDRCHNEKKWTDNIRFDHDLGKFPLIGQHAAVACEECHQDAVFKNAPVDCNACHKANDVHKQTLTTACGKCHTPNSWALWEFDHNKQTEFKLDGGHVGLTCMACHRVALELSATPRLCHSCHKGDDVHRGGFGQNCERCHVTDSFKETILYGR